ncbi:CBS domain-containing protein [Alkalinema pantanalense CENA528]|uniref:CBS domain-containing protein n=1 Tax=Alkalinema pantanalense TaxID=1620705 RepID=UPI003D6FD80D
MTKQVITIQESATVAEAIFLMKKNDLRSLFVELHRDTDSYGMVTEIDIMDKVIVQGYDSQAMYVDEIMTKPCIVVKPEWDVEYVAQLFAQTRTQRAPVIKNGLLGVISVSDILRKSDLIEKLKTNDEHSCEENPSAPEA